MTKVTIDRELLEQVASEFEHDNDRYMLGRELRAILAAPRQPEGDAISRERVQAEADAFFDWPTADKSSVTTTSCLIFARCIAGMVAAERDATIERLEAGIPRLQEQAYQMRQQRDKLAGLLRMVRQDGWYHPLEEHEIAQIDAALAEVNE